MKLQPTSQEIWETKYQLKDSQGNPVDKDLNDMNQRVATALASVEPTDRDHWYAKFLWALENGAIPAGRILSNVGAEKYKPATSTINCTVSGQVPDSMEGILDSVKEAGLTLKAGCGIGYDFSTLRPRGAFVNGAGAYTSGPLTFMDIYDRMCMTISSAGARRGAQMATFDIRHPDVEEFITAKREDGRLRQFNCSLLITDRFMDAVKGDADWQLIFPTSDLEPGSYPTTMAEWPGYSGPVLCRVYKTVRARDLWNTIMKSTYDFAEPGFILIDKVNQMNNNWFCEDIRATNPCGEQPLPPYGSCLLGSVNLTHFVRTPFGGSNGITVTSFDWSKFKEVVGIFTRMLDNVVELNGLALPQQQNEIFFKRRHGMGFLGLGSALTMMGIKYGSKESVAFTEEVSKELAMTGWETGLEIAKEKGPAPIMEYEFIVTQSMLDKDPYLSNHYGVGDRVKGKELLFGYSSYAVNIYSADPELHEQLVEHGCRFTHHTSIAPTGTISLSIGNNVSNGIEPSFAHHYKRNVIKAGKKSKESVDVFSYELMLYRELVNPEALPGDLPEYFITSDQIGVKEHVDIQAASQKWIDSSISKTINIPTDYDFDDFQEVYMYAYEQGLKGCTTFRFNPEAFQGVLVQEKDLEATTYQFTLENGDVLEFKGNEEIEYDGEVHTAANLHDALKEGFYGKY